MADRRGATQTRGPLAHRGAREPHLGGRTFVGHEPDLRFRVALRDRLEVLLADSDLPGGSEQSASDPVALTAVRAEASTKRRNGRVASGVVAIVSAAAVVAALLLLLSRPDANAPADTPNPTTVTTAPETSTVATTDLTRSVLDPSLAAVLSKPSTSEAAQAARVSVYRPGTGHSDVTAQHRFTALSRCWEQTTYAPCVGNERWAYVTGAADSADVHYGLLPTTGYLVVSSLDDRLFVVTGPAGSTEDPQAAPPAWLIDSVTGERGELTWQEEPAALDSPDQVLVLFPSHPQPYVEESTEGFLPRIVDRRDWSIRPLHVPADASAAIRIHQTGSGRIWVGIAPDGGDAGLAYSDNGGASWKRVELPSALRPSTQAVLAHREVLTIAASGSHVAVSELWGPFGSAPQELFLTSNSGADWESIELDQQPMENATEIFALPDGRLVVVLATDSYVERLFMSSTASDWSGLDELPFEPDGYVHLDVSQNGIAVSYGGVITPVRMFSTDLITWWTIPGFPSITSG